MNTYLGEDCENLDTLASKVSELNTGLQSLKKAYNGDITKAIKSMLSGAAKLTKNNKTIKNGATQLETSGKTLTSGASQLSANSGTLDKRSNPACIRCTAACERNSNTQQRKRTG